MKPNLINCNPAGIYKTAHARAFNVAAMYSAHWLEEARRVIYLALETGASCHDTKIALRNLAKPALANQMAQE